MTDDRDPQGHFTRGPNKALRDWLIQQLGTEGVRIYKTTDKNPSRQLKNKLSQAAGAGHDAMLVLFLASEEAYEAAREALIHRWVSNPEWSDDVATVILAYPLSKAVPRVAVQRRSTDHRERLSDALPGIEWVRAVGASDTAYSTAPPKVVPARQTEVSYEADEAPPELFLDDEEFTEILTITERRKNVILQGPPGVGKTFIARYLARALAGSDDPDRITMVQFHQSYGYEDFVRGYRPTEGGGFAARDGIFMEVCHQAREDSGQPHVLIIDEINRGNLSKILGEAMMLIEADKRSPEYAIPLAYRKEDEPAFYVPENLLIVGLMNTADRSLSMVDYALRRRFSFVDIEPRFSHPKFSRFLEAAGVPTALVSKVVDRMERLNDAIAADTRHLGPGFRIGHSFFCDPAEPFDRWFERVIEREVGPLLREYWFDDPMRAQELIETLLS